MIDAVDSAVVIGLLPTAIVVSVISLVSGPLPAGSE